MTLSGHHLPWHEAWPIGAGVELPHRPRVWAMGLTYAEHAQETRQDTPPVVFEKACLPTPGSASILVPGDDALRACLCQLDPALAARLDAVAIPALLDYEVEIGLVMLDDWRADSTGPLPRWGYFLANDVTVRSIQMAGWKAARPLPFWSAAKSFAGFLPVARSIWVPHQAHPEAWPDIELSTHVNGQLRQHARLSALRLSPLQLLTCVAQHAPDRRLHQGDLILTGTPGGIALQVSRFKQAVGQCLPRARAIQMAWRGQQRSARFLNPGDTVTMQATGLDPLSLTVEAMP